MTASPLSLETLKNASDCGDVISWDCVIKLLGGRYSGSANYNRTLMLEYDHSMISTIVLCPYFLHK